MLKLIEPLDQNVGHILYFDNWFNFIELQEKLLEKGFHSNGTLQSGRLRGCELLTEKQLSAKGRGSFDCKHDFDSGISIVRWMDKRCVQLSSSHVSVDPVGKVKRTEARSKSKVDIICPAIVKDYNSNMGGVDLFDMSMSTYRHKNKSTKWYRPVFLWGLNLCVINGWIQYKREAAAIGMQPSKRHDLLSFTSLVSTSLIQFNKSSFPEASPRRGRPPAPTLVESNTSAQPLRPRNRVQQRPNDDVRLDRVGHFPSMVEASRRQKCRVCNSLTQMTCVKCKTFACVRPSRNCFIDYHTK